MLWLKTLLFTVTVPGLVTVVIPWLLLGLRGTQADAGLGPLRYLGVLPLVLGSCGFLWCAIDFATTGRGTPAPWDPPRALVANGLYRLVRNPMYVSVVWVLLGVAILFQSALLAGYALVVFIAFHLRVLWYEEPVLLRSFGETYRSYCATVPRWLPRPRRGGRSG